jgi:hypothetical protein
MGGHLSRYAVEGIACIVMWCDLATRSHEGDA